MILLKNLNDINSNFQDSITRKLNVWERVTMHFTGIEYTSYQSYY